MPFGRLLLVPGVLPMNFVSVAVSDPPLKNIPPPGFALALLPGHPFCKVESLIITVPPLE